MMIPENHSKCIVENCKSEGMFVIPHILSKPDEMVCYKHYDEMVQKQKKKYYSLSSRFDRMLINIRVFISMRILYFKIFLRSLGCRIPL